MSDAAYTSLSLSNGSERELSIEEGKEDNDPKKASDGIEEGIDWLWVIPGVIAGTLLMDKYVHAYGGYSKPIPGGLPGDIVFMGILFGPSIIPMLLSGSFRREIWKGRMSWATYWMIMTGIFAATFAFIGVNNIASVFTIWRHMGL